MVLCISYVGLEPFHVVTVQRSSTTYQSMLSRRYVVVHAKLNRKTLPFERKFHIWIVKSSAHSLAPIDDEFLVRSL